jgi:hypothetical protein
MKDHTVCDSVPDPNDRLAALSGAMQGATPLAMECPIQMLAPSPHLRGGGCTTFGAGKRGPSAGATEPPAATRLLKRQSMAASHVQQDNAEKTATRSRTSSAGRNRGAIARCGAAALCGSTRTAGTRILRDAEEKACRCRLSAVGGPSTPCLWCI